MLINLLTDILANQPSWVIYLTFWIIIFCETGLIFFPFLPGDSLLFLGGSLIALNNLDFFSLISLLSLAAIAGDSLNFKIGQYFGNTLKNPNWQRWIKPQDLRRTNNFYYKYGRMAIFLGRFIPVIRTIIPFTAGIGKMKYQDFILFNLLGGFSWVFLITSGGFLFGNLPFVKSHFELLLLVIILFSLSPFLIIYFQKSKEKSRQK
ncbi:VTT domain-containing protein [Liquorilactobacillus vini]|jgi:membrane-associated protein|uniref:VTT domain-containing protein n=1 Tax=Liquorilactobacillus vini DSM 20605 TaxID=1133569 RepID=A0A0R2BZZ9_9LACO|nr:VTT domain-containing protein [Liquorilactobacillus vini]KRM84727.1 hypothetical protein FD21_GL001929 [Liquorilactobacillus vini DSM 20605]